MPSREVDVAIAGGGPAGAAAAHVLAQAGLRVLLADTAGQAEFKVGEGLPPSARHLLRELGVLSRILADGPRASHGTLAFWDSDAPRAHDFVFQLGGDGLQLDRRRFDEALLEHARAAGTEVVRNTKLCLGSPSPNDCPHLVLRDENGEQLVESHWLIDATGRPATLARQLGATRVQHDKLLAFHMRLATAAESDRDGRTWVEAVEDGWWYSVLLPSRQRLVAFLSDADLVNRQALLTNNGLLEALNNAPNLAALCREHRYEPASSPRGAPASSSHLDRAAGSHTDRVAGSHSDGRCWLAAGDAAIAFDPLSSKGISNALYTGMRAAQAILAYANGGTHALSAYSDHLLEIHRAYLQQVRAHYAMNARWIDSAFWARRREEGSSSETPTNPSQYPVAFRFHA